MKIGISTKSGFTLVEIMIVATIIGLLAAIVIPNFIKATNTSRQHVCINNLRQIDSAKQEWATEHRAKNSAIPAAGDIAPYLGRSGSTTGVVCPAGGAGATFDSSYSVNAVSDPPTCQIVAGTHQLN